MAREPGFNFGHNRKPRKAKKSGGKKSRAGKGRGNKSNAWRSYVSNAPIPD